MGHHRRRSPAPRRVRHALLKAPPACVLAAAHQQAVAEWPSGLEHWTGDRTVRGSNPNAENFSLRNFGNSVYPALPVCFGGDTKSRRSLLSGVYARGSKRPHQSVLECVTVVDSTAHSKLPQTCVYAAENAALH